MGVQSLFLMFQFGVRQIQSFKQRHQQVKREKVPFGGTAQFSYPKPGPSDHSKTRSWGVWARHWESQGRGSKSLACVSLWSWAGRRGPRPLGCHVSLGTVALRVCGRRERLGHLLSKYPMGQVIIFYLKHYKLLKLWTVTMDVLRLSPLPVHVFGT